jgi:MFS family permease
MPGSSLPMSKPELTGGRHLGPIHLLPGVTPSHTIVFLFADLVTIGFVAFVVISQTYLMNANLGIPEEVQGTITGDMGFWSEVAIIIMVWFFGMLADHTGRRLVMAGGLIVLGTSYILYPLSESVSDLLMCRLVYAVGVAATTCMLTVIVHDYPQDRSRGKLVVASGICGGLGASLIGVLGGRLPDLFISQGATASAAGFYMNWVAAAICIAAALVTVVGMHPGIPGRDRKMQSIWKTIAVGFSEARDRRVALAYMSAFAARGDLVIVGTFIVLWGTLAGRAEGMDTAAALGAATLRFVIVSSMSLVWAPVMGYLLDRFDRITMLAFGAAFAALGFCLVGLIENPLDPGVMPLFFLLGIGQASCFYASQALIGHVAPVENRGAVVGTFSACGAVGVLFATGIGGRLFDSIGPGAPFLMVSLATAGLCIYAIWVRQFATENQV